MSSLPVPEVPAEKSSVICRVLSRSRNRCETPFRGAFCVRGTFCRWSLRTAVDPVGVILMSWEICVQKWGAGWMFKFCGGVWRLTRGSKTCFARPPALKAGFSIPSQDFWGKRKPSVFSCAALTSREAFRKWQLWKLLLDEVQGDTQGWKGLILKGGKQDTLLLLSPPAV